MRLLTRARIFRANQQEIPHSAGSLRRVVCERVLDYFGAEIDASRLEKGCRVARGMLILPEVTVMMILLLIVMISVGNLALGFGAGVFLGHGPREKLRRYLPAWLLGDEEAPSSSNPPAATPPAAN